MDLPTDYVSAKFYEFGLTPSKNTYNNTYQCGCPICREGNSLGRKRRCYYTPEIDLIYCHNCGWSSKPYHWIREVSGMDHEDIEKELLEGEYGFLDLTQEKVERLSVPSLPDDCINLFDPNQLNYWKGNEIFDKVVQYMEERRLFSAVNRPDAYYYSFKDKIHRHRLIIPFKDVSGDIVFYQSRKIFDWDDSPKYKSKINSQRTLFGIDKVDPEKEEIFIFEGPIDSTFIKNGIAVGGITESGEMTFTDTQKDQWKTLLFFKRIWVLDSQWIDEASYKKSQALLKTEETVFIWPEKFGRKYKDLNELCADKRIDQISKKFILDNSFSGLKGEAKMKMI